MGSGSVLPDVDMPWLIVIVVGPVVVLAALWGTLAIYYAPLPGFWLRVFLALVFALATPLAFVLLPRRDLVLWAFAAVMALILVMFFLQSPSNHREWQPPVAVLPRVSYHDDGSVTVHSVRNFRYRSENDFDIHYDHHRYPLEDLQTLDMFLSYWSNGAIAHVIMSFGFSDGRYLALSVETRKSVGEEYSAIQGFFRQYELIYVAADERDVVQLRTNHRKEDVYLYRVNIRPPTVQRIFLSYLSRIEDLYLKPEFYNALLSNCATNVVLHTSPESSLWDYVDWRVVLSGHLDRLAYDLGFIDTRLPFHKLRSFSRINEVAHGAAGSDDFSRRIRQDLPVPPPLPELPVAANP